MKDSEYNRQLLAWAKRATKGLDESATFMGILDDRPLDAGRIEFTLQVGHCLLVGKPIILAVPHGVELPPKLEAAAEAIVPYHLGNPESLQHEMTKVLTELGIKQH